MKMCYNDIDIKSGCTKFESELMLLSNTTILQKFKYQVLGYYIGRQVLIK